MFYTEKCTIVNAMFKLYAKSEGVLLYVIDSTRGQVFK